MYRYRVEKCDNGGTLCNPDGSVRARQITWGVVNATTGVVVADYDTRDRARAECNDCNGVAAVVALVAALGTWVRR